MYAGSDSFFSFDDIKRYVDIKHFIDMYEERGMDTTALRARYQSLREAKPRDAHKDDPQWAELAREILALDSESMTDEPSDLPTILARRPSSRRDRYEQSIDKAAIANGIGGGWRGRVAGCVLGKPVECLMKEGDRGKYSRRTMRRILETTGEYPLNDFFSVKVMVPYWESSGEKPSWFQSDFAQSSLREKITYAANDDDLDYTVLGLRVVRELGRTFTPEQVLDKWMEIAPGSYGDFTPCRMRRLGLTHPALATFLNPQREWIQGQIRADIYGFINPGKPADAAAMAWADAATSNTKNGIYGAMWVAAALAAAFVEDTPEAIILRGLEQVPEDSRFALQMLATVKRAKENGDDFEATFADIQARLGNYHPIHTINNACIVAAGLLHGGHDFGKVICTAVMGGLDTDCNGATAGSIAGVMLGEEGIPDRWKRPFNDTLSTGIPWPSNVGGDHRPPVAISDLIAATARLASTW